MMNPKMVADQILPPLPPRVSKTMPLAQRCCGTVSPSFGPTRNLTPEECAGKSTFVSGLADRVSTLRDGLVLAAAAALESGASYEEPVELTQSLGTLVDSLRSLEADLDRYAEGEVLDMQAKPIEYWGWPSSLAWQLDSIERNVGVLAGRPGFEAVAAGLIEVRDAIRGEVDGAEIAVEADDDYDDEAPPSGMTAGAGGLVRRDASGTDTEGDVGEVADALDEALGELEQSDDSAAKALLDSIGISSSSQIEGDDSVEVMRIAAKVLNGWPQDWIDGEAVYSQLEDAFYGDAARPVRMQLDASEALTTRGGGGHDAVAHFNSCMVTIMEESDRLARSGASFPDEFPPAGQIFGWSESVEAAADDPEIDFGDLATEIEAAAVASESIDPPSQELTDALTEAATWLRDSTESAIGHKSMTTRTTDLTDVSRLIGECADAGVDADLLDSVEEAVASDSFEDALSQIDAALSSATGEQARALSSLAMALDEMRQKSSEALTTKDGATDTVGENLDATWSALDRADKAYAEEGTDSGLADELSAIVDEIEAADSDPEAVSRASTSLEAFRRKIQGVVDEGAGPASDELADALDRIDDALAALQASSGVYDERAADGGLETKNGDGMTGSGPTTYITVEAVSDLADEDWDALKVEVESLAAEFGGDVMSTDDANGRLFVEFSTDDSEAMDSFIEQANDLRDVDHCNDKYGAEVRTADLTTKSDLSEVARRIQEIQADEGMRDIGEGGGVTRLWNALQKAIEAAGGGDAEAVAEIINEECWDDADAAQRDGLDDVLSMLDDVRPDDEPMSALAAGDALRTKSKTGWVVQVQVGSSMGPLKDEAGEDVPDDVYGDKVNDAAEKNGMVDVLMVSDTAGEYGFRSSGDASNFYDAVVSIFEEAGIANIDQFVGSPEEAEEGWEGEGGEGFDLGEASADGRLMTKGKRKNSKLDTLWEDLLSAVGTVSEEMAESEPDDNVYHDWLSQSGAGLIGVKNAIDADEMADALMLMDTMEEHLDLDKVRSEFDALYDALTDAQSEEA